MEGEKAVHIIDLYSFGPAQWFDLLQKLSSKPEGPPHLKITAIHENKEVLEQMDHQLTEKANNLNIPFQFNPIVSKLENLDLESLHVKTGEVLAISSVLQLHSVWATDKGMVRNSPVASKNRPKVLHINQRPLREFLKKDLVSLYMDTPDYTPTSSPLSLKCFLKDGKLSKFSSGPLTEFDGDN